MTIIRGDLIHDRGARQRIVFESEEPITGLETQSGAVTALYISTTSRILTLVIAGRGQGQPARILEDTGCGLGCMTLDGETGDILIAREDAVYTYGPRGRGSSYAFESSKTSINSFRDYVALVCPPRPESGKGEALRKYGVNPGGDILGATTFTLLDTDLKFIAHSEALVSPMKHIFMEWGDLFLLTTDGKVCVFSALHIHPNFCIFLISPRSFVTGKRASSRGLKFSMSATSTYLPLTWHKRSGSTLCSKTQFIANTVTSYTSVATMTRQCSNISGRLTIPNPHRLFARLVYHKSK